MGDADAAVSGLNFDYPDVFWPALRIHQTCKGARIAAGVNTFIV